MKKRIANLISNTLNPFLVSLVVIMLLSFASTSSTLDAFKWSLLLIAVSILPVFLVTIYLAQSGRIDGVFTSVRRQRTKVYLVASVCALLGFIILSLFKAPLTLVAAFAAGLSAIVIFMVINMRWKISVHSAFIAASITTLVIIYGRIAGASAVLIPLIGWSRIELKHHSLAQVVTGALLAILIVIIVFYLFGLV
ncbi:phosphatase PAP2 family protein [Chloroflexota bacterium]